MRVLFTSVDPVGHVFPLIPLAQAVAFSGHEVLFNAGASLTPWLESAGIATTSLGMGTREAFRILATERPIDADARQSRDTAGDARRVFGELLPRSHFAALIPEIDRFKPDLVIAGFADHGAGLAALNCAVPLVRHGFGRGHTRKAVKSGRLDPNLLSDITTASTLKRLRRSPLIDIYPASLQPDNLSQKTPLIPMRPVSFNPVEQIPNFVTDVETPLIYLTLGTVYSTPERMKTAIESIANLGARVIVAIGHAFPTEALGTFPSNVVAEQWVPQSEVIRHADLVVSHAGSGTTLAALSAGVPHLLLPQGADNLDNAAAVSGAGAGEQILPWDIPPEAIAEAAARLLNSVEAKCSAQAIAQEIAAMPSPADVVEQLVEWTAAQRPRRRRPQGKVPKGRADAAIKPLSPSTSSSSAAPFDLLAESWDFKAYATGDSRGFAPVPARKRRAWMDATPEAFARRCLPLVVANQNGWIFEAPFDFSAKWDGTPNLDGIQIQLSEPEQPLASLITSHFGSAVLTVQIPWLFRTPPGIGLLVRGAPNFFIDGAHPLEGLVETDWASASFTMNWRLTRPHKWARFRKGDPLCFVQPIATDLVTNAHPKTFRVTDSPELADEYRKWAESRAAFNATNDDPRAWERDYFKGVTKSGEKVPRHRTGLKIGEFPGATAQTSAAPESHPHLDHLTVASGVTATQDVSGPLVTAADGSSHRIDTGTMFILRCCDGKTRFADIVDRAADAFDHPFPPTDLVRATLQKLLEAGLIETAQ